MSLFKKFLSWARGEVHVGSVKKFADLAENRDAVVSVKVQIGTNGSMIHTGSVGKIGLWTYTIIASMPIGKKKTAIFSEQVTLRYGSMKGTADAKERGTAETYALLAAEDLSLQLKEQIPNGQVQLLNLDGSPFTKGSVNKLHADVEKYGVHL